MTNLGYTLGIACFLTLAVLARFVAIIIRVGRRGAGSQRDF